ncbi:hypothetical protein ACFVSQ_19080 [Streptomyces niveus]|uniref:hypothetical protein n=1 Tax=Streptomyces niveus TaxID=193462 RepID=UPI0036E74971
MTPLAGLWASLRLTQIAEGLLAGAVVYERERGSSWEDMAQYQAVREWFSPYLEKWNMAFDETPANASLNCPQPPTFPRTPADVSTSGP